MGLISVEFMPPAVTNSFPGLRQIMWNLRFPERRCDIVLRFGLVSSLHVVLNIFLCSWLRFSMNLFGNSFFSKVLIKVFGFVCVSFKRKLFR